MRVPTESEPGLRGSYTRRVFAAPGKATRHMEESIDLARVTLGSSAAVAYREGLMLEVGPVLIYLASKPCIGG